MATPTNPPILEQTKGEFAAEKVLESRSLHNHDSSDHSQADSSDADPEARPQAFKSTFAEIIYIITCTLAIASVSLLSGSTIVIVNQIGNDLHLEQAAITWLYAAPSLTCGSFMLLFGRLADLFGRKTLFIGSMFAFAVFALAAGFCNDGISLDAVNGLMGLAGAAVVPPATGSLGTIYPKPSKRKNYAFACFSAGNPLGFVLGGIGSGVATLLFGWRASFWLLAIIYLMVTIMAFFYVPADTTEKLPLNRETLERFDLVGAILGITGVALFTAALTLGGSAPDGWRTSYVIALLVIGFFILVGFVLYELRYPYPVMPMSIWRDRDFSILIAIVVLGISGFTNSLFWVSLYIQRYWTSSAIHVAAYLLPAVIMGTIANVVVGSIMHRFSNKLLLTITTGIYIVSFLLLSVNQGDFGYWPCIFTALMLVVWGADVSFCIANVSNLFLIALA